MSEDRDGKFGSGIGTITGWSRWFKGEPKLDRKPLRPVRVRWLCPHDDCDGEMQFNGLTWPTGNPGYHHTCTKCGFTAAVHGRQYPTVEYEDSP